MQVLLLELNELNFESVLGYAAQGKLPTLKALIDRHGISETVSEEKYEELEPWIQWVTAHTGLSLSEHETFRLGDFVKKDIPQIWEMLEREGLVVGAISPMNAANRCAKPAFFVPDPWTSTTVGGRPILGKLHSAIAQAVNDNAQSRLTPKSAFNLLRGFATFASPRNFGFYVGALLSALRSKSWAKPLILDALLSDVFVREVKRSRPDFASLFLNAGAHIQHHYMFNAATYDGPLQNPDWYLGKDEDPVADVYALYDRIVRQVMTAFPNARLILATGLHQDPHSEVTFYWRLRDHADFLRNAGVPFERIEPRMSRDFVVICANEDAARTAEERLSRICSDDGCPLFTVENRGADLFVELSWSHDIPTDFTYRIESSPRTGLRDEVAFVALKNGRHNGIGYVIDTGVTAASATTRFDLAELPRRIASTFAISPAAGKTELPRRVIEPVT